MKMNRRRCLLCLASGTLLKTAGAAVPFPECGLPVTTEAGFSTVTLIFKLQCRWVPNGDPSFSGPYWDKGKHEYRWAATNPANGDVIVADEETAARWDRQNEEAQALRTADNPTGGFEDVHQLSEVELNRIRNRYEREVIGSPEAWKNYPYEP